MVAPASLTIGKASNGMEVAIMPGMANRHGLIAGATGTGKTVTLQRLAEQFSRLGVPVFAADVKGDLSGIAAPAQRNPKLDQRLERLRVEQFVPRQCPVLFWDVYAEHGHPVRTTVSEMGPLLLSRILQLNDIQTQVLQVIFKIADDQGLLLLDCKDLRELLSWAADHLAEIKGDYGNVSPATLSTIQRAVLTLQDAGADKFFGEPALKLEHLQQRDFSGNGVVSLLDATKLLLDPRLYSTFLLWLLSELFEQLPEVGDLEKPKLVFFFDEAHLLFNDTPRALLERIEQVVRLIRSKGIGVYFITQNPADIPETVLAQLGNRIQHALRAYTPSEQRAVRTAAQSFRPNPSLDTERVITELEVGEALVSVLDSQGRPTPVERVLVYPPESQIGMLGTEQRAEAINRSPLKGTYEAVSDRESAYEVLKKRAEDAAKSADQTTGAQEQRSSIFGDIFSSPRGSKRQSTGEALVKSIVRSVGSSLGRQIVRGVLGSLGKGMRIFAILAVFVYGMASSNSSFALEPVLGDIVDTRSSGKISGSLRVELKVQGDEVPDIEGMRASVISVFDETGRDLMDLGRHERQSQRFSPLFRNQGVQLQFKNPSRKAAVLRELIGRLDLFMPRNDPESVLVVENILSKLGEPLGSTALKNVGFSAVLMDRQKYEAKLKAEKASSTQGLGGTIGNMLTGFGGLNTGKENTLYAQIKDPEGRFVALEFDDGAGASIKPQSTVFLNDTYTLSFASPLPPTTRLRIKVATPKAVIRVPFQFENVVLP